MHKEKRVYKSREEQKRFVKAWQKSGLSKSQFCQKHDINFNTFNTWRKNAGITAASSNFIPLKVNMQPQNEFQLLIKERFTIKIPSGFCEKSLSKLVRTLEEL